MAQGEIAAAMDRLQERKLAAAGVAAATICFDVIAIGLLIAEARQREQAGGS